MARWQLAPPPLLPESLASCQLYQPTITFTCPSTGMLCPPEAGICTSSRLLRCSAIQQGLLKRTTPLYSAPTWEFQGTFSFPSFFSLFFWIHDYETGSLIPWVSNISSAVITRASLNKMQSLRVSKGRGDKSLWSRFQGAASALFARAST